MSPTGHARRSAGTDLPAGLAAAIEAVVARRGGGGDDVRELAEEWRRALADSARRTAAIRAWIAARRCACADGGTESHGAEDTGRCGRCYLPREDGEPQK
jgi:hypothetical protein